MQVRIKDKYYDLIDNFSMTSYMNSIQHNLQTEGSHGCYTTKHDFHGNTKVWISISNLSHHCMSDCIKLSERFCIVKNGNDIDLFYAEKVYRNTENFQLICVDFERYTQHIVSEKEKDLCFQCGKSKNTNKGFK